MAVDDRVWHVDREPPAQLVADGADCGREADLANGRFVRVAGDQVCQPTLEERHRAGTGAPASAAVE
jgi:hypothetical protein